MEFSMSKHDGLLEISILGKATSGELMDMIRSLVDHEGWNPGAPLLINEEALEADKISVEDVRKVADYCVANRVALGNARIAILAPRDLEYGMNRMFLAFLEGRWNADSHVFKSRADALQWLS